MKKNQSMQKILILKKLKKDNILHPTNQRVTQSV